MVGISSYVMVSHCTIRVAAVCDAPWTTSLGVLLVANQTTYTEGENVTFACDIGMKWENGDINRTCLETRQLSGDQLTCTSKFVFNISNEKPCYM